MKYFVILFIAATIVAVSAKAVIEKSTNELSDGEADGRKPPTSIQSLFKTLYNLVQGVLNHDKFVLDVLGMRQPLDLSEKQKDDLKKLAKSLDRINKDLKNE